MVLDTYLLMLLGAYVCKINGHIVEFVSREMMLKKPRQNLMSPEDLKSHQRHVYEVFFDADSPIHL